MIERKTYEVWNFAGSGHPAFASDDPVEVVHWLRSMPPGDRFFNVHPIGRDFHRGKMIAHDFISRYSKAAADDIVKKAFARGEPEGVAQEIIDLMFGR